MSRRSIGPLLLAVAAGFCITSRSAAVDPKGKEKLSLSNLSLEIAALQTMHQFQLTAAQKQNLLKLAADTATKETPREAGKGSAKLRQTMTDLRDALLRGNRDLIEKLEEQLDDLLDAEDSDLDDAVEITAAAHRRAGEVLQTLSPRQLGAFITNMTGELPDPLERLLTTLDEVGKMNDDEWKEFTTEVVDELSWQLGGADPDRSNFVGERVGQYLKTMRSLSENEFRKQRPELEKMARQFVGQVPPTVIVHNVAERALAEMLSNPRLAKVLAASLKK